MRAQRLLLRVLGPRLVAVSGLILILIGGVFLAESFTGHMAFVLHYGGSAKDLALVLLLGMPEILDLALPLAVLVGVHIAVADTRDEGAWVISSAAGVGPWQITIFVGLVGVAGFALSLLASGWLVPQSSYAQRMSQAQLRINYTLNRITRSLESEEVLQILDQSFVVRGEGNSASLLILTDDVDSGFTISRVEEWHVVLAPSDTEPDLYELRLGPMQSRTSEPESAFWTLSLNLGGATFRFGLDELLPDISRERGVAERTLAALFPGASGPPNTPEFRSRVAELLARALLVPIAAILGLVTTLLNGPAGGRLVGLPLALGLMLSADLGLRPLLVTATVSSGLPNVAVVALAVLLVPPLAILLGSGERMVRQRKGNT